MDLREQQFGIEIEFTGITREKAAKIAAEYFGTNHYEHYGGSYDEYRTTDSAGRTWKFVRDRSINCQRKRRGEIIAENDEYSVEMVSPICNYEDISTIQEIVRALRKKGAMDNSSVGIHIHISAAPFDARTLRNLVNIVAAKEDIIYKALRVDEEREAHYCQRIDRDFLDELNQKKPKTMERFKDIWYRKYAGVDRNYHYHSSRYRAVNLHSVFTHGTVEFRAFNGSISHAGKIKAYIQFCLAITAQALNQKYASKLKTVTTNDKYTFRVWLLRLGMIDEEFATARKHLLEHLDGNIAWKDPAQAVRQRERLKLKRQLEQENMESAHTADEQSADFNFEMTL